MSKEDETSLETVAYGAHIAALLGAHIIKVKPPKGNDIKHIVRACFDGKRLLIFSGGVAKSDSEIMAEVKAINDGGGNGSIIGRNSFTRPREEALKLLNDICELYKK